MGNLKNLCVFNFASRKNLMLVKYTSFTLLLLNQWHICVRFSADFCSVVK